MCRVQLACGSRGSSSKGTGEAIGDVEAQIRDL